MDYKLVAIDCDGTLITEDQNIPVDNFNTLKKLMGMGIKIVIVTGRNDILVERYVKELGLNAPVIGCNGATVRDVMKNKYYAFHPIDKVAIKEISKYLLDKNIGLKLFSNDTIYADDTTAYDENLIEFYFFEMLKVKKINNIDDFLNSDDADKIIKIIVDTQSNPNIDLLEVQKDLEKVNKIESYMTSEFCLDFMAEGVSKGAALLEYINEENILPEEVVAIGDSENDNSMMELAGFSVAMGNAHEDTKKIADLITADVNNSGVARALEQIFKL